MAIIIGDGAPTRAAVDAALGSLTGKPRLRFRGSYPHGYPCARFEHDGTAVALIPAAIANAAQIQAVLEHVTREHVKASAYISGAPGDDGIIMVILATRGASDMDRILAGVTAACIEPP